MHLLMTPKETASVLKVTEATVRRRIRNGSIKNIIGNGAEGHGTRYLIDMTKEFGMDEEKVWPCDTCQLNHGEGSGRTVRCGHAHGKQVIKPVICWARIERREERAYVQ